MKILIIDDEPFMLSSLKDLIVGLGYHCETANNGKRAFELLKNKSSFDAIICDFNMPEMTGLELRLKLRDEFDSCPPFILLSGDISQVKDDEHRQLFYSLLQKPGGVNLLRDKLREIEGFSNYPISKSS